MSAWYGLPVTVIVSERGSVSIESGITTVSMNAFSETAKRLTLSLGVGIHVIANDKDVADIDYPGGCWDDIVDAMNR